ncbi:hypothetical protein NA57DRAFT_53473 [Rhizodiscina lignyota]|uniref:Uncharacterized protein n=1 Tax=Rhizodiscina lignyota TaxID=1504668 RepID=A0A9P4M8X3_9PEZI|nr:hypothetical protein NA57DRAFT_53473 [Rhizodiscina lignyota]
MTGQRNRGCAHGGNRVEERKYTFVDLPGAENEAEPMDDTNKHEERNGEGRGILASIKVDRGRSGKCGEEASRSRGEIRCQPANRKQQRSDEQLGAGEWQGRHIESLGLHPRHRILLMPCSVVSSHISSPMYQISRLSAPLSRDLRRTRAELTLTFLRYARVVWADVCE